MKKIIALFLISVLMLSVFCIPVLATENPDTTDSRYISTEILQAIDLSDTEFIFKIYPLYIRPAFADHVAIEDIMATCSGFYIRKRVSDQQLYEITIDENGLVHERHIDTDNGVRFYQQTFDELQTNEAIKAVSADITVERAYYFWGENYYSGTAIYYQTNLGDYVYYCKHFVGECLFPADVFFAYQRRNSIDGRASEVLDLSVYKWKSPNFNPHAEIPEPRLDTSAYFWIGGIAVIIVAEIVILVIRAKKEERRSLHSPI